MSLSPEDRTRILLQVLQGDRTPESAEVDLQGSTWESEDQVVLKKVHLRSAIGSFLAGLRSADELHAWAEFIEGRDDIDFACLDSQALEIIRILASRQLEGDVTRDQARGFLAEL